MTRVLIVDQEHRLESLESALRGPGREIVCVHSDDRAIEEIRHRAAAVALLEVEAPDMAAVETARALRWFNPHLPLIVVSATAEDDQVRRAARSLGALGGVPLPIDATRLGEALARLEAHSRH